MNSYLLATKLRPPPQPYHTVPRDRLSDALERSIPQHKLILLSAPAGYGKTTLLVEWARPSRLPVVWLSLSEEDNDFERFFRYLLTAWEELQPGVRESPLGLLLGSMAPDIKAVLTAFINATSDAQEHLTFVLDDYHLIEDAAIHEALTFLLEHLPPSAHFVLASRAEPPLPLARYRAHGELLELSPFDLAFQPEESEAFLNHQLGLKLSHDELVSLQTQLEGWIAGLQLASLTLKHRPEVAARIKVSGRHRFIADYLKGEVLARQSEAVRRFLLQTSILERLSGPLCDVVTGEEGAQERLEHLERENLFLVPLDDDRTWFRYHRLFAECLQEELKRQYPEAVAALHRRAGRWHLAQDLPEEALHHAVAGDDLELGIQIGERYFHVKLLSGEFRALQRWIESLPKEWQAAYPSFGLIRAGVFFFTGAFEAGIRCVDEIEQGLLGAQSGHARRHLARVAAFRCFVACMQHDVTQAEGYAERALQDLPAEDHAFRADIHHALGDTYRRLGHWEDARACYLKVLELTRAPTFRILSVHVLGGLADLELRQGRLRTAAAYWRKALATLEQPETRGSFPLPLLGWLHLRLGEALYEWNELEAAEGHLFRGLERAELGGDVRVLIAGYLSTARLKLTLGDVSAAEGYLERARPLVESAPDPEWRRRFERVQLELWLAQDKLRAAVNWADELLKGVLEESLASEVAQLATARVLVVKGDAPSLERALALLKQVLEAVEAEGRRGVMIEALALLALARWQRGDRMGALTALERALRTAEPEGYLRLFADLGLPMARLLQEARSRQVMPDYVEKLLAACAVPASVTSRAALPEPLTPREQEVLQRLAVGLTNREIAERLSVSPETVKKHASSICSKLGAGNRTEAAARARELNLLD